MTARNRQREKSQLSKKERNHLFVSASLCSLGAAFLCIEGWIPWVGSVLYLAGLVNWLVSAIHSENLTVVDHSEFLIIIPPAFIWLIWGRIGITMNGSHLVYPIIFSLIISALFILVDWYKQRRSSLAAYIGWSLLTILLVFFLIGLPFFTQTNVQLDPNEKETYEGIVIATEQDTSTKSTTKYYVNVSFVDNDGQSQQETIRIQRSQYLQIQAGQNIIVIEGQGLYGASYWMIDVDLQK